VQKLMAPFFTPRGVATYADLVIRDSLRFAVRWEDLADEGREVDLSEEMMLITASIILKAMFSSETPESISQMKSAVETMITYVDTQMVPVRVPTWVPSRRNRRYFEARDLVHGSIAALIAERRAICETDWPNDLLSRLMEARDPDTGEAMTETLLRDESITMFFAGHETTARTMAAAWYALGTHPEVTARLHEELDSLLADHAPTLEELHHLPYTLQVVKEVLRLYPAAPFYARDAIEDDPDKRTRGSAVWSGRRACGGAGWRWGFPPADSGVAVNGASSEWCRSLPSDLRENTIAPTGGSSSRSNRRGSRWTRSTGSHWDSQPFTSCWYWPLRSMCR